MPERALLRTEGGLRAWSHGGYGQGYGLLEPAAPQEAMNVLTPAPTVAVLSAGYVVRDLPTDGVPA